MVVVFVYEGLDQYLPYICQFYGLSGICIHTVLSIYEDLAVTVHRPQVGGRRHWEHRLVVIRT